MNREHRRFSELFDVSDAHLLGASRQCCDCFFCVGMVDRACLNGQVKLSQRGSQVALCDSERNNPNGKCGPEGHLWMPVS